MEASSIDERSSWRLSSTHEHLMDALSSRA